MNLAYLVERVKRLILQPKQEWAAIEEEDLAKKEIFTRYVMILAAIPPVAGFIGYSIVGVGPFGSTGWAAGVFNVIPSLWIIGVLLSLYGLYLIYVGLPILMRPPPEKFPPYLVVVVMAAILLVAVLRGVNDLMLPSAVRGF